MEKTTWRKREMSLTPLVADFSWEQAANDLTWKLVV